MMYDVKHILTIVVNFVGTSMCTYSLAVPVVENISFTNRGWEEDCLQVATRHKYKNETEAIEKSFTAYRIE